MSDSNAHHAVLETAVLPVGTNDPYFILVTEGIEPHPRPGIRRCAAVTLQYKNLALQVGVEPTYRSRRTTTH